MGFPSHRMLRIDHPSSLHSVSHDNMSRDSDQGLRRRRERRKTNISGHKLRFIPAPAIIYNPPYRITFHSIIYGEPNLYKVFRALLLFESASNTRRVIDAKYGIVEIVIGEKFARKLYARSSR